MPISSEQIRAARALLRIEQKDLAEASGVSLATIKRLETKPGPLAAHGPTAAALQRALEAAGIQFVAENGGGAGVRLKYNRQDSRQISRLEGEGGVVLDDDV